MDDPAFECGVTCRMCGLRLELKDLPKHAWKVHRTRVKKPA